MWVIVGSDLTEITDLLEAKVMSVVILNNHTACLHLLTISISPINYQQYSSRCAVLRSTTMTVKTRGRNLALMQAQPQLAAWLKEQQALQAITLNSAKLGNCDKTGSLLRKKDANIVVSTGDLLDVQTNNITEAFIREEDRLRLSLKPIEWTL